tara:strand:- start:51 stop:323 length:273 start_codon:yes stop_codon:yes gene_type:complete
MKRLDDFLPCGLPAGLRMMVIDVKDYRIPYGTVGTLNWEEKDGSGQVFLTFDGDSMSCGFPLNQLRIVGYSGKKFYKRDGNGELVNGEKR